MSPSYNKQDCLNLLLCPFRCPKIRRYVRMTIMWRPPARITAPTTHPTVRWTSLHPAMTPMAPWCSSTRQELTNLATRETTAATDHRCLGIRVSTTLITITTVVVSKKKEECRITIFEIAAFTGRHPITGTTAGAAKHLLYLLFLHLPMWIQSRRRLDCHRWQDHNRVHRHPLFPVLVVVRTARATVWWNSIATLRRTFSVISVSRSLTKMGT